MVGLAYRQYILLYRDYERVVLIYAFAVAVSREISVRSPCIKQFYYPVPDDFSTSRVVRVLQQHRSGFCSASILSLPSCATCMPTSLEQCTRLPQGYPMIKHVTRPALTRGRYHVTQRPGQGRPSHAQPPVDFGAFHERETTEA